MTELLIAQQAWTYLGVSRAYFFRLAPCLPRVDVRTPGAERPVWRYPRRGLDMWIASRTVPPGRASPAALN